MNRADVALGVTARTAAFYDKTAHHGRAVDWKRTLIINEDTLQRRWKEALEASWEECGGCVSAHLRAPRFMSKDK